MKNGTIQMLIINIINIIKVNKLFYFRIYMSNSYIEVPVHKVDGVGGITIYHCYHGEVEENNGAYDIRELL